MKLTFDWRNILLGVGGVAAGGMLVGSLVQARNAERNRVENRSLQSSIVSVQTELERQSPLETMKTATVAMSKQEEAQYLDFLRRAARDTGVSLARWSANSSPMPVAPPPGGAPPSPLLKDVRPMPGILQVVGPYPKIVAFNTRLLNSPRLLNLTNVNWTREDKTENTRLEMTITRYVDTAAPTP